jgi:hypothetical protein
MEIAVLVEPVPGRGYRARGGEPFSLEAEGSTKEEALRKLGALIASRIEGGAEVVSLRVPAGDNPWIAGAGMFKGEPLFDEWQAAIAERREGPE